MESNLFDEVKRISAFPIWEPSNLGAGALAFVDLDNAGEVSFTASISAVSLSSSLTSYTALVVTEVHGMAGNVVTCNNVDLQAVVRFVEDRLDAERSAR